MSVVAPWRPLAVETVTPQWHARAVQALLPSRALRLSTPIAGWWSMILDKERLEAFVAQEAVDAEDASDGNVIAGGGGPRMCARCEEALTWWMCRACRQAFYTRDIGIALCSWLQGCWVRT